MNNALRGVLAVLALFLLSGALGECLRRGFDQSIWLADLRAWPMLLRVGFLVVVGVSLLLLVLRREPSAGVRVAAVASLVVLLMGALIQSIHFYTLWRAERFSPGMPVPLTLGFALTVSVILYCVLRGDWNGVQWRWGPFLGGAVCALIALPLSQMVFFGKSDYRRSADAIVVLGARAYADGRLSDALQDRMGTAVQLYHEGRAPRLILSGGPGDGAIHETEAMRDFAVQKGVPLGAIALDRDGVNTEETAQYVATLARQRTLTSVLAVSHAYHLPRVKMALERNGVRAYTVPAHERYVLRKMPYLMAREVAALWVYYFSGVRAA